MSTYTITDELMTPKEFIKENEERKEGDKLVSSPTKQKDFRKWRVSTNEDGKLIAIEESSGLEALSEHLGRSKGGSRKRRHHRSRKHRKSRKSRKHRRSRRHH